MKKILLLALIISNYLICWSQTNSNEEQDYAIHFDGKSNYLEVSSVDSLKTNLNTKNTLTIEAWIKPSKTDGYNAILNKHWCKGRGGAFHFGIRDGKLNFVWTEIGHCDYHASITTKRSLIKKNKIKHIAITFDNGEAVLYVNGRKRKTTKKGNISHINTTSAPIILGSYRLLNGDYTFFFEGDMDNIRMWNVARTKKEIKKNRKSTIDNELDNLLLNFTFEDINKLDQLGIYKKTPICYGKNCDNLTKLLITK
jgi:hypothetical protein